ncbi:hypothetical protein T11_16533 [Trichinella zimbabwensis]|uniref:Uncharacterized protein n=1 Tax=Trichinella zimbabwensis TaxID=268475 RepID=A0A0V1HT46_9BILA|nr:hypothetical protein T11_16533 [Trichinella zimbabwensis]
MDSTKNAPFIGKKTKKISVKKSLNFVKLLKQITLLSGARYSAYFDTKLSILSCCNEYLRSYCEHCDVNLSTSK